MAELYLTFGLRYGNLQDAQAALDAGRVPRDPHPLVDWASGNGWLTVQYTLPEVVLSTDDPRERARQAAWSWLEGHYAFDYDERPSEDDYPLGELARLILP